MLYIPSMKRQAAGLVGWGIYLKAEDIMAMTKREKKEGGLGHVIRRTNNRRATKVTERQPRNCRRNQERQKTRWRDAIRAFTGAGWRTLASNRDKWRLLVEESVMQWNSND